MFHECEARYPLLDPRHAADPMRDLSAWWARPRNDVVACLLHWLGFGDV